jgi:Protein of unknown function (DUF3105)
MRPSPLFRMEETALAKDRTPENARGKGGPARASGPARGSGSSGAGKGKARTRPPTQVVTAQRRPWGLIAAAVAVVVFAVAAISYAVIQVNRADANQVDSVDEIDGVEAFDYAAGQEHVTTSVDYEQTPPVGGPHDPSWADCTGTVYDVDIRHENAVHSLEHGAVWITYDPAALSDDEVATLADFVEGESGRMLSPFEGQEAPISLQSWNHQLTLDSVDDPRIEQFADFLTYNAEFYPEPGASCENPVFAASPLQAGEDSAPVGESMPTDSESSETTEPSEAPAS